VAWLSLADAATEAFRGVRVAVSGAAPLPREVLVGFAERFGVTIWEGYGLTETAPALTSTSVGGEPKPGSIGRPLPGVELRLVNEEGDDVELGDPGEVVVRGPNVFRGYWQHPDDTSRAFSKGWFRTGDVAVADDDGDLYLVDRKRDLILVSGFNVYPKEVEDVLRNHPKITDCAVIGAPDPYHGEQVRAIVVADGLGEQDVIAHCAAALAPYKVPAAVEFTDQIPRNAAGKVLRRVLRD
jgi:long-chain acyl-CoA synthetase